MSELKFQNGERVVVKSDCNSKGEIGTVTGICRYPDWYDATYITVKLDNGTSQNYNSRSLRKLNNEEEERKMIASKIINTGNLYVGKQTLTITGFDNANLIVDIKNNIKDVIFNDPATVVIWNDNSKTVVKCQKETGDTYNKELGLAMCIIKKLSGNTGNYNDVFKKWIK